MKQHTSCPIHTVKLCDNSQPLTSLCTCRPIAAHVAIRHNADGTSCAAHAHCNTYLLQLLLLLFHGLLLNVFAGCLHLVEGVRLISRRLRYITLQSNVTSYQYYHYTDIIVTFVIVRLH